MRCVVVPLKRKERILEQAEPHLIFDQQERFPSSQMPSQPNPLTTPEAAVRHLSSTLVEHCFTGKPLEPMISNPFNITSIARKEAKKSEHCSPISLFAMHHREPRRDVIDLCYLPDGVHREYMLCGRMQVFLAAPEHNLLLFIFTPRLHSRASEPYLQVYHTTHERQGGCSPRARAFSAAIKDVNQVATGHVGFVDVFQREPGDAYEVGKRLELEGDRADAMTFSLTSLIIGTKNGAVHCFSSSAWMQKWSIFLGKGVRAVHVAKEYLFVACVGDFSVWNISTPSNVKKVGAFNQHKCRRVKVAFDVSEKFGLVAVGGDDGKVRFWHLTGGDPIASVDLGSRNALRLQFVEDGGKLSMWAQTKDKLYVCGVGEWGISARWERPSDDVLYS